MYEEIKIERGIPVPRGRTYATGISASLRKLKVGESFVVPSAAGYRTHPGTRVLQILSHLRRDEGLRGRFTTRTQEDGSARVWRIE